MNQIWFLESVFIHPLISNNKMEGVVGVLVVVIQMGVGSAKSKLMQIVGTHKFIIALLPLSFLTYSFRLL